MNDPNCDRLALIPSAPIQNVVKYQVEDVVPHRRSRGAKHDQ
mgnify:CR=1 FL=1